MPEHIQSERERAVRLRPAERGGSEADASPTHPLVALGQQVGNARIARMLAQREAGPGEDEDDMLQPSRDPGLQREAGPGEDDEEGPLQPSRDPGLQREGEAGPAAEDDEEEVTEDKEEQKVQLSRDPGLQREAGPGEDDEEGPLQPSRAAPEVGLEGGPVSDATASKIDGMRGGGSALDDGTRTRMEGALGDDFSDVRVHTGAESAQLNRSLGAKAFTTGSDVFFGENTGPGDSGLLAHELTHVVQQRGMAGGGPMTVGPADDAFEREAESSAAAVSSGATPAIRARREEASAQLRRSPAVQRNPAAAAMGAAEWIGLGAAGYAVAQDAVSGTAGDISYTFDEMEGVLLPGGGNDVPAYRTAHPNGQVQSYTHTVSTWLGWSDSRKMGVKFGITFSYDGFAIGNVSCRILDTYDWPMWGGSVNVNITPMSLAAGGIAALRITLNLNADVTVRGGVVGSRVLQLDGTGTITTVGSGAYVRFSE